MCLTGTEGTLWCILLLTGVVTSLMASSDGHYHNAQQHHQTYDSLRAVAHLGGAGGHYHWPSQCHCGQAPATMMMPRRSLAQAMYQRLQEDECHRNCDHREWYRVDLDVIPVELRERFLQCSQDEATNTFLENCFEKADGVVTQMYHSLAKSVLTWFMTPTCANGWLGRGSMFVFSKQQFRRLLDIEADWRADSLLDLGAGDGKVTEIMAGHFKNVYATEVSSPMRWRLHSQGYQLLDIDEWHIGQHRYDVIACLNLLDRCDRPMTILHQMRRVVKPDTGRIIVALVLPFNPYVEINHEDHKPTEYIYVDGTSFEEQVTSLIQHIFEPSGFSVIKYSRLPYLCEGDLTKSFYYLPDAVFVLKPV